MLALPVQAHDLNQSTQLLPEPPGWQHLDLGDAKRLTEQVYQRGVEILEDHVERQGSFRPEQNVERQGHLSLKLYPKGKAHSEDSLTAETWFGFANKPEEDRLYFDFKLSKHPKHIRSVQDYL
jgi:hypothetical protein